MNKTNGNQQQKIGSFAQRIGSLIEAHVINEYNLTPNKRQHRMHRGFYDAYDTDMIYEIKSTSVRNNRLIFQVDNHNELLRFNGKYIVILYDLINKDKALSVITDLTIKEMFMIGGQELDKLLKEHGTGYERNFKGRIKQYDRLRFDYLVGDK